MPDKAAFCFRSVILMNNCLLFEEKRLILHIVNLLKDHATRQNIGGSQCVSAIDHLLYEKYDLSYGEIAFIEKMTKPVN